MARKFIALSLLQSFESFKKIRLEKGQFVVNTDDITANWAAKGLEDVYASRQREVIFAGFEKAEEFALKGNGIRIQVTSWEARWWGIQFYEYRRMSLDLCEPTAGDLIETISRYNKAASEPIQLKFTENIIPLLGVKI